MCHIYLYFYTGDRYAKRKETIERWMAEDRKRDTLLSDTEIPDVACFICSEEMEFLDKMLRTDFDNNIDSVQFYFGCKGCEVTSTIRDRKREDHIPWQCPKCKRRLESKTERSKKEILFKKDCTFCGYHDLYSLSLEREHTKEKIPSKEEVKRFREDRLRFCLSEEEGASFLRSLENFKQLEKIVNQVKEKENLPKVSILSVKQAQDLVKSVLKENGFENISFKLPEARTGVTLRIKAVDGKDRNPYDLKKLLKKALNKALDGSNWRLMSNGIGVQLGLVTISLNGVEAPQHMPSGVIL